MSFALFLSRSRDISQHQAAYYGDDPDQTYNSPADWRIFFYFTVQLVGALGLTLLLATMIWPSKFRRFVSMVPFSTIWFSYHILLDRETLF